MPSALVTKLRKQPEVRDAEALAAWIGRYQKLRKAGVPNKKAMKLAGKEGGMKEGGVKDKDRGPGGGDSGKRKRGAAGPAPDWFRERQKLKDEAEELRNKVDDGDDPFAEDYFDDPFAEHPGDDENKSGGDSEREKYEAAVMREMEGLEKGKLYNIFMEMGGLKTRDDLREEYREIPNTYKRKDGMAGDEMAEYIGMYYPEFGIETENDLLEFFAA